MATHFFSNFTLSIFFLLTSFLFLPSPPPQISALNITSLLSSFPDLSDFNNLLSTTSVAQDLTARSSLTLLVVPNSLLRSSYPALHSNNIADVLRYHVLLQYLSWPELRRIPATGKLITTLYQTTGRASYNLGDVNISRNPKDGTVYVRSPVSYSPSNVTLISMIKTLPYNVSIFTVNSLLIPYGYDLMASENRPPLGLNVARVLLDAKNFNVAASMLTASGVAGEFEDDEGGAGLTIFVATDQAYADLPFSYKLQSLTAYQKYMFLKFHVLHSYYPLGSLESIVNPVQPTLATEDIGAGRFTLNITRVNGSVAIDTGIVQATITQTVFDQNPVSIFAVSRVLLPREYFGEEFVMGSGKSGSPEDFGAQPPDVSLSLDDNNSPVSSPNGAQIKSSSNSIRSSSFISHGLLCIGLYLIV